MPDTTEFPDWTPKVPADPSGLTADGPPLRRSKPIAKRRPPRPKTLDSALETEFAEHLKREFDSTAPTPELPDPWLIWDGTLPAAPLPDSDPPTAAVPTTTSRPPADTSGPAGSSLTGPLGPARSRPPGRPTKYDSAYCELVKIFMGATGRSLTSFAGFINVNPDTVYSWRETIPEFGDAARIANAMRVNQLEHGMYSANSNHVAITRMFGLKNAAPNEFKDRFEVEKKGGEDLPDPKFAQAMVESAVKAAIEAGLPGMLYQLKESLQMRRELEDNAITHQGDIIEGEIVALEADEEGKATP